jgi:hypothetical protein
VVPGSALITPVGEEAVASAAAAAGPDDEMPQTEAAVRPMPEELPAVRAKRILGVLTEAVRFAHELTHVPSRSWCSVREQVKGLDDRRCRRAGPSQTDELQPNYHFLGKLTILTLVHVSSGAVFAVVGPMGVNPHMAQAVLNILDCRGLQEIAIRTDQEPSVQFFSEVRANLTARISTEVSPRTSRASVGGVERTNQEMGWASMFVLRSWP